MMDRSKTFCHANYRIKSAGNQNVCVCVCVCVCVHILTVCKSRFEVVNVCFSIKFVLQICRNSTHGKTQLVL